MRYDIILAGVGGQGVLSVSGIIAAAAMQEGLSVKQSEVHGMSQRGGAVIANLRMGSRPVASDLVPLGCASLILSMEPLESLRYLRYLSPAGAVVTSTDPVRNIDDYPELDRLLEALSRTVDREEAKALWREYQAAIIEEQPYTFFYFPERQDGVNVRVKNAVMDARGEWVNLKDWYLDPASR